MKGIILCGGSGTRLYPSTTTIPKSAVPVYDKPCIYYSLSTLIQLGIKDILIISNYTEIFKKYFQRDIGINFSYKHQEKPRGIAEALILGEEFIKNDNVALILGDNIFTNIDNVRFSGGCNVICKEVDNPCEYGVIEFISGSPRIIEKPKETESNYIVTGLYLYDSTASSRSKKLKPSKRNELEITDLNNDYINDGKLKPIFLKSDIDWFDTGTPDSLYTASKHIKSLKTYSKKFVGYIEYESFMMGNIDFDQLSDLVDEMPECKYTDNLASVIMDI